MPKEINMKRIILIIITIMISMTTFAQQNSGRIILGEEWAKKYIDERIKDTNRCYLPKDGIVKNKEMAIKIAEIYLDSIYGYDIIKGEKPFEVYNYNGYWLIAGTLPKGMIGGTAVIIISKSDGKVMDVRHYK
jgi:hypothetical protein